MSPSHGLQVFTNCPSVGPSHEVQSFRNGLLQHRLPMGSQPPSGMHLLRHGVTSMGCRWTSAPPWTSMGCRGQPASPWSFITSCKRRLSALIFRAPPPPSFHTDLGVCRVVSFTSSHSSLSTAISRQFFLPFLKYVILEALPLSLIDLVLASSGSVL